jgi:hypothetical protein
MTLRYPMLIIIHFALDLINSNPLVGIREIHKLLFIQMSLHRKVPECILWIEAIGLLWHEERLCRAWAIHVGVWRLRLRAEWSRCQHSHFSAGSRSEAGNPLVRPLCSLPLALTVEVPSLRGVPIDRQLVICFELTKR